MSSDSETDQSRSGNARLSNFEEKDEEPEFVVREGAARSNDGDIDRPHTREPMTDTNWVRKRNELLLMRLSGYLAIQSW